MREKPKEKNIAIDIMRIIAAYFVILCHVSGGGSVFAIVCSSFARFSVPLFVVISGYFMLNRQNRLKSILSKCGRLMGTMVVWSALYYAYFTATNQMTPLKPFGVVRYLLTEPVHLWYIYAIVTLYLLTPLLQVFSTHASKQEYLYALGTTFVLGSIVIIAIRSRAFPLLETIIDQMKVPYTLGFVCLYLAGGFLGKFTVKNRNWFGGLFCLGSAVSVIGTLLLNRFTEQKDLFLSFFAPGAILSGISLFVVVEDLYKKHPIDSVAVQNRITDLSSCTFGIYLLHPLVINVCEKVRVFGQSALLKPVNAMLVFVVSAGIVLLGRKLRTLCIRKAN